MLNKAKLFMTGRSQAVRLPREFRFDVDRVEIFRRGDEIVLRPLPADASFIADVLREMPADFMVDGRDDTPPQERDFF